MTIENEGGFDRFTDTSHTEKSSAAESGTGGTSLNIWTTDRITKLGELAGGNFTNNSSFSLPSGVVTSGMDTDWVAQEKKHGINVQMLSLDPDGKPMTGKASIKAGDQNLISKTVSGSFILSGPPMPGVVLGQSVARAAISFQFMPSTAGIAVTREDFGGTANIGTVQYGGLEGTVTDYNGAPAANVTVEGPGMADVTDSAGDYELLAPGGTEVTLSTLSGTYEFTLSPSPGQSLTQDIQFPQLTIRVLDADYAPVENAPVVIDGSTYYTNESGEVNLPKAVLKSYSVTVMDYFEGDVDVPNAGEEFAFTVGPGETLGEATSGGVGGVKITAVDAQSGRPITDMAIEEVKTGATSASNGEGVAKILTSEVGNDVYLRIGTGDERYQQAAVEGTLPDGAMIEQDIELEPKTQTSNL